MDSSPLLVLVYQLLITSFILHFSISSVHAMEKNNLLQTIKSNNIYEALNVLSTQKEHIEDKDPAGMTPLMRASKNGSLLFVQALLIMSAKKNACDNNGWTPLMYAVQYNHIAVAKQLITAKVNITAKNKMGKTALHLALESNNKEIEELLRNNGATIDDAKNWCILV